MNYLEQIVHFNRWKEVNPLPASAIALWHEIMAVCNKAGWPKEFTVPNAVVQSNAGVSRKEFDRARQMLIDLGLINYKKSQRVNHAGKYAINTFPIVQKAQQEVQQGAQQIVQRVVELEDIRTAHERGNERGTLFKLNNKPNQNDLDIHAVQERLRQLINLLRLKNVGMDGLETVYSYIGQVDVEVIEKSLKKSEGKSINYFIQVINGFIEQGKTTAESVNPVPNSIPSSGETESAEPNTPSQSLTEMFSRR